MGTRPRLWHWHWLAPVLAVLLQLATVAVVGAASTGGGWPR